jgi:hypothetical protein
MKKIITLLASVTMFASAFAQYNSGNQKDYGYDKGKDIVFNDGGFKKDDNRFNDHLSFGSREKEMQIAQINRDYDFKIMSVKNRFFMSREKKEGLICMLEDQRKDAIKMVYAKSDNGWKRYDDHDSRKNW